MNIKSYVSGFPLLTKFYESIEQQQIYWIELFKRKVPVKVPLYSESQNHLVKIIIKLSTPGELASASTTFTIHICKFEVKL